MLAIQRTKLMELCYSKLMVLFKAPAAKRQREIWPIQRALTPCTTSRRKAPDIPDPSLRLTACDSSFPDPSLRLRAHDPSFPDRSLRLRARGPSFSDPSLRLRPHDPSFPDPSLRLRPCGPSFPDP